MAVLLHFLLKWWEKSNSSFPLMPSCFRWLLEFHCVPVCVCGGGASVISLSLPLSRTHTLVVLWLRPWLVICHVILFLGFKNAFFSSGHHPLSLVGTAHTCPELELLHLHTLQILMLNLMEHFTWAPRIKLGLSGTLDPLSRLASE